MIIEVVFGYFAMKMVIFRTIIIELDPTYVIVIKISFGKVLY